MGRKFINFIGNWALKIAVHNLLSCGGCDPVFFLEESPEFFRQAEVIFWNKVKDDSLRIFRKIPDQEIEIGFLCGAVKSPEHEEVVRLFRTKCRRVVAVGACALWGGIPGLLWSRKEGPKPLSFFIAPDLSIPGCPPEGSTWAVYLQGLLSGRPPGPSKEPVCKECPRDRHPFRLSDFKRFPEANPESQECYLSLGVFCAGAVTQKGCGARCLRAGYPCLGCYGPPAGLTARGERLLSAMVSALVPQKALQALKNWRDPVGSLYRFDLATHPLVRKGKCGRSD